MNPARVPAVYLTSAFSWFLSVLLFPRISKLRSINLPEGFDSNPGSPQTWKAYLDQLLKPESQKMPRPS
jgi:hypothetical protein